MAAPRTSIALMILALAFIGSEAAPVRQLFVWDLAGGVAQASGAKNVRIALYNSWNKVNKNSVSGYWLGQQNDGLLFAADDGTWGDFGGVTDWSTVDAYKSYKVWEKNQPAYKALPVTGKKRLVTYAPTQ